MLGWPMLPDPPARFSEKPLADLDPSFDRPAVNQADFPDRCVERYTRKIHRFFWQGPPSAVSVAVTDDADDFGARHCIAIEIPPGTLFPLDDFSFPAGADELARAGDAKAFVQERIFRPESTNCWKDAAARAKQGDLFGVSATLAAPRRPRRGS